MSRLEELLTAYAEIMPQTVKELWLWMALTTMLYLVTYFIIRFYRKRKTSDTILRVFVGVIVAGIMFSYTLVLIGGVLKKEVLETVVGQPAGQTILLLYSAIVLVVTVAGPLVGYSRIFAMGGPENRNEKIKHDNGMLMQQRLYGITIVIAVLTAVGVILGVLQFFLK